MPGDFVVDLTQDDEDDVVFVKSKPVAAPSRERAVAWDFAPPVQSQPAPSLQTFSPKRTNSPVVKQSPGSRVAARPGTVSAQETPQATPSKSARFSVAALDEPQPLAFDLQPRAHLSGPQAVPPPPLPTQILRNSTPQPPRRSSKEQHTPRMQTPKVLDWTVDQIAGQLGALVGEVHQGHGRLVEFMLEEAERRVPEEETHLSVFDDFADMKSIALEAPPGPEMETMVVKFKQHSGEHGKYKGSGKRASYPVVCIKCDKEPVPRYRFHHVEVRKNILTPNTMLNFVPHLRDVDPNSAEEKKYSNWLAELDKLDTQSGFKTQDRSQKLAKRERDEYAATLSMYLEPWLQKLAIDGCSKSTLIRYMASQPKHDDAITPQQKSTILNTHSQDTDSPQTDRVAKLFTEAFDRIFNAEDKYPRVSLRDILLLDKTVETIVDNRRAKDTPSSQKHRDVDLLPQLERNLASYTCLGCLICFSHDCEHGEFDADNQRLCVSLDCNGGLARTLMGKWKAQIDDQGGNAQSGKTVLHQQCKRDCYRMYDVGNPAQTVEPWSSREIDVLKAVFTTLGYSTKLTPSCFVAAVLGRLCWDVRRKYEELKLSLPPIEPRADPPKVKPVSWYDRKKKQLIGDWQDLTVTHEHAAREDFITCHHDGPCTVANGCPCAGSSPRPVLCESFCLCTAEECALKFTGCACHSLGKTCLQKQKEGKPCICVQLNRECDPVLCIGCKASDRADPENAHDEHMHSTGCQNVVLQRGASKVLLLGKSQLEGCGYGLFTAEDIAQDEFVIEYTGELITHDEGVRREARRGDVFDEEHTTSYLFTLLEEGGIWVDAAIYGNLSRYINHASEHDKKGSNITPKIMYVNGEWRIKFTALREIKAGEELFFNYGDNFPNLTKKLLDKDDDKPGDKRKSGTQRGQTARKTTTKNGGKGKGKKPLAGQAGLDDDVMDWTAGGVPLHDEDDMADDWEEDRTPRRRKKRGGRRPGAGRKKKVVVDANQPRTEINDSQDESSLNQSVNTDNTPNRSRRLFGSGPELGTDSNAATRQKLAADQDPSVKKVSKRGGARPGAGRKPKHPKQPIAPKTEGSPSAANVDGGTPDTDGKRSLSLDSDDVPLMSSALSGQTRILEHTSSFVAAPVAPVPPAVETDVSTSRKRKMTEFESDEDDIMATSTRRNDHGGGTVGVGGSGGEGLLHREAQFRPIDDDEDDDESIADRPRKRTMKMPARYL
ncbi:hypothetical protein B0T14DRAFT_15548 [Immersiella caudata]|uniref:Uncharacterized protein n=1 Tax=Immersiella caudata TaxID=314043 RepID=A0AA40CBA7_9PEZI|nr:hypothetical protein B0T14DRAFT_15548 [Immersiella caudata]